MPNPTEHKAVQGRIFEYAAAIGWTIVSSEELVLNLMTELRGEIW